MDKHYYSPIEMLKIASQHAYCAQHLLANDAEVNIARYGVSDALAPISSLMYTAFEMMFKAFLLHDHRPVKQHKNLQELVELNIDLGFSNQDIQLMKKLSRQVAFRKGIDYELWENRQQQHVFCIDILRLFQRLHELMPLELQYDYQA
ncbi:hypothetical protein DIZ81_02040 [Legionella taurinensis]|uniref:HEPN domain-containing protein n=1 Tax=Legionella taurinensis TaxID=70611 RepID=A0A3A5L2X1_9GAMM|nr:hypothetical protein [Legionella taurinensis]MDX1836349.1 hypothetical protein [Legionella taurinensis]PUT41901.1 hypothetical protein DB744_02045 [Legionella taurinensis]PUT44690.1 hypothetical protein DB746_02045 [Legionella taurinensis]PUT48010.1 hypothetical protein DB743_00205 [Legionella taurinensis]PUT48823.1 hypothetical protein DB745_02045 [Legionella taurinensis]